MSLESDDPFIRLASEYIDLANTHGKSADQGLVGAALLHAAARYNAFVSSTLADDAEHLRKMRDEHISHHAEQFARALMHHYDGYIAELDAEKAKV